MHIRGIIERHYREALSRGIIERHYREARPPVWTCPETLVRASRICSLSTTEDARHFGWQKILLRDQIAIPAPPAGFSREESILCSSPSFTITQHHIIRYSLQQKGINKTSIPLQNHLESLNKSGSQFVSASETPDIPFPTAQFPGSSLLYSMG